MKIIKPCDWKEIDLLTTTNADDFGEALRGYCFVGNSQEKGCYSTFNVREQFTKILKGKIFEEAFKKTLMEDIIPTVYHYKLNEKHCWITYDSIDEPKRMKFCEPYEIVMGWVWDGDGILYFRFNDRKVVNDDCKKSYGWEWVE